MDTKHDILGVLGRPDTLCAVKGQIKESEVIKMPAKILVSTEDMPYADWLEYRKQGIGGSDASVVCGINRYKSPVELWMEKTDQMPSQEAGEAAYWGTQLEPFVRAEFTKRTGICSHALPICQRTSRCRQCHLVCLVNHGVALDSAEEPVLVVA